MSFHVDEELLRSCLRSAHPDSAITVRHFEDGQYAVEPGTNYSSEIIRVRVEYECDGRQLRQCLVFKVPFLNAHYEFLNELGFYDKETYMYAEVLPRMSTMLRSAVVPRHYFTTDTHVLALEDLGAQGYYLQSEAAFDYEHCACTLRALAMFQAASAKLHLEDDQLLAPASHEAIYTAEITRKSMRACYPVLLDVLRMEHISPATLENFAAYEQRINDNDICQLADGRRNFNVLNHGDLKTNNIMFKKDDSGLPVDVKLLDYQTCRWNSPVLDLIFFNMATMDYAVYEKRYDELLDDFLATFNETLNRLDCADCAYNREDYEADMEACKLFKVFDDLPESRVVANAPFAVTGVDFAGPFNCKPMITRFKVYAAVFVYFAPKALHIEVAYGLSTEAFLAVFQWFITQRGLPHTDWFDNDTNFCGTASHLSFAKPKIRDFVADKGISWRFNPQRAPHPGGLREATVKSAKHHMHQTIGEQVLNFERFTTYFAGIEDILNSRPLVAKTGRNYLNQLQQRTKWETPTTNLVVNDMVLLRKDLCPPAQWKVARVRKVMPDRGGYVRTVKCARPSSAKKMSFHVDEELLRSCLRSAHPESAITVRHYEDGQYIVEPGTNYTSEIVQARVEYECDGRQLRQCLVFKVPFLNAHYEFLNELGFYDKETYMYAEVLPRMSTMLRSAVVPRHYFTTDTHVLALEDLGAQGYYLQSEAAFDYEHCACTLRALAMFQAASAKLHLEDDQLLAPASHEAIYTAEITRKSMRACYPVLLDVLRMEHISPATLENFAAYEQRINDNDICQLADGRRNFNVLNHGDLKTNNIMFKKDDSGLPVDVKLLDYQTCRWNSPVLDLIFFNMATMDYAVYEKRYDELLDDFLATFNETLNRLDCADCAYNREDYEADMEACKLFKHGKKKKISRIKLQSNSETSFSSRNARQRSLEKHEDEPIETSQPSPIREHHKPYPLSTINNDSWNNRRDNVAREKTRYKYDPLKFITQSADRFEFRFRFSRFFPIAFRCARPSSTKQMSFQVDEELLRSCLQSAHPGSAITVRNYGDGLNKVVPGTNYTSEIVHARVEYECDGRQLRQSLVFKIPFLNAHFEFMNELGFYDKETYMYAKVLPRMRTVLRSAVVPRHFHTTDTQVLALEDLNAAGYYLLRQAALDYEHCACTLRAVAKFHAASAKLHLEDEHLLVPASHEGIYVDDIRRKTMRACYPVLLDVLRMEHTSPAALANFAAYEQRISADDFCRLTGGQRNFNVLNHGDLKTNNMMFKKDDHGQPVDIKLVDYQTCCWNSPVLDLIFFNMATMDYAVYEKRYDELLGDYLATLNETLSELGCADCAYTRENYEADMEACKLFQASKGQWFYNNEHYAPFL
ncbi:hypothetical protein V9T40_014743 [Parthenolecanium corni]|uniref:Integrase catalytic domain-containing protein n=1 Tax=Parthenolecanium corni TaxID=536013 RepID=A0AAN9T4G6_9HEMI